ncbi:MAG: hypothetical protein R3F37_11350 [Candidatus Competibacteraceae bacterium]
MQRAFEVHDLLGDDRYLWHGARNYVELNPQRIAAPYLAVTRPDPHRTRF